MTTKPWLKVLAAACIAAIPFSPSTVALAREVPPNALGTVSFPVSCAPAVQSNFNRGVALLHDFWYEEAKPQFERILKTDPECAMAHWGIAMSVFHQIWDRPDEAAMATGWREIQAAQAHPAKTERERAYIAAVAHVFQPGPSDYQMRIDAYSAAMGQLYAAHPEDVDAAAFYSLSLLAAKSPTDSGLQQEHKAMQVLVPLWPKYPDHPGLVHYIIHSCDNPTLAPQGLAAARAYGKVAPTGPHAVHMPGHIFSRLGLWQEDIDVNNASVEASRAAEARHESGWMDQFHSDDFLVYAYLQSGQEQNARSVVADSNAAIAHYESMSGMAGMSPDNYMTGMFPYYRVKLPIFIALETRDWPGALKIQPVSGAPPETQLQVYWARIIAAGHLRHADQAHRDFAAHEALMDAVRKGRHAYMATSTSAKIEQGELLGWVAFANSHVDDAIAHLRDSADLQDRVGQGEVDIPAREMLADVLLEANRPKEALTEYQRALALSPNRFNGLFNAGQAAEAAGDAAAARHYFSALLKATDNGSHSNRAEIAQAKKYLARSTVGKN
jgi:tetratricopeptide (TPR) repeat protein